MPGKSQQTQTDEVTGKSQQENDSPTPLAVPRIVRVPLRPLPDETWRLLRRHAYQGAVYGNALLSEQYAAAKGLQAEWKTYTDHNQILSAAVRDAIGREVIGIWRREGRKVLRGEQTLGRFSADRALVVRDRGVRLVSWGGGNLAFHLRVAPKPAPLLTLPVEMRAVRGWKGTFLNLLLQKLLAGQYPLTKASVVFERPGRKVSLFVAYAKLLNPNAPPQAREAEVVVLSDCTTRLQAQGQVLTLTDRIYRLIHMKQHFERIHARLRASLGKAGRRRDLRRSLRRAGNFETWAQGPLHVLSAQIVAWCQSHSVTILRWHLDPGAPSLPWAKLQEFVKYKGEEIGLVSEPEQQAAAEKVQSRGSKSVPRPQSRVPGPDSELETRDSGL